MYGWMADYDPKVEFLLINHVKEYLLITLRAI
jgi:hypothetical protein